MWTRHHKRSKAKAAIVPLICISALAYFGYHANNGIYGLKAKERYVERIVALQLKHNTLQAEVDALEHRTSLLRDGSIEKDILDEQARAMLGYTRSNEIVIRYN